MNRTSCILCPDDTKYSLNQIVLTALLARWSILAEEVEKISAERLHRGEPLHPVWKVLYFTSMAEIPAFLTADVQLCEKMDSVTHLDIDTHARTLVPVAPPKGVVITETVYRFGPADEVMEAADAARMLIIETA